MRKTVTVKTSHLIAGVLCLGLIGSMASSCDSYNEPFKDAPRTYQDNNQPMSVVQGADGFSNAGTKCDGYGGRIFVAYHGENKYASVDDVPYGLLKPSDPCRNQG